MRILTDCREHLTDFLPPGTTWEERGTTALGNVERKLWQTLSEGSVAWTTQIAAGGSAAFWRRLIVIGQAARSQFDALQEALCGGLSLDGPTAAVALAGREFHGQRGRPWSTATGNLFLTVGLPFGLAAANLAPGLIMLPAVAVVNAIRALGSTGSSPSIKWVNDILIDGRKVGGVLAASLCRDGVLEAAVLGLGVNVAHAPTIEPTPFVPAAGCLADAGAGVSLANFIWCVLDRLAERYQALVDEGPAGLLRSYREASSVVGRRVRVWDESLDRFGTSDAWPVPLAAGVVKSIESDLSLRIEGREEPITRGRLALEDDCVAFGL